MNAGKLRHKITVTQTAKTLDQYGIETETTTTLRTCWAAVEHRNPSEKWAHGAIEPNITDLFTVRYSADITRKMRVAYSGKVYDIEGVEDIRDEHKYLLIQAREVV